MRVLEIGWRDIGEEFRRYCLFESRRFNVFLHRVYAPQWHPQCHDHPWSFLAVILWGGYMEQLGGNFYWRRPGSFLWRAAECKHNVANSRVSWSLIITGPKRRKWGHHDC